MPSIVIRGRWAWVAAIVVGAVLLGVGLGTDDLFFTIAGGVFALFGIIFLILSFVTRGQTD